MSHKRKRPENSRQEVDFTKGVFRIPNDPIWLNRIEREIFEAIRKRELMPEDEFMRISPHNVTGNFLIITMDPRHPRNKWSCLLQRVERDGLRCFRLVHEIPMAVKKEWDRAGKPPRNYPTEPLPTLVAKSAVVKQRGAVNPQTIGWRENDSDIGKIVDRERERIRQLRRECYLWSQIDWDKTDEEISREMRNKFAKETGAVRKCSHSPTRVRFWRARRDWLHENKSNLRRSPKRGQHFPKEREWIEKTDTSHMTPLEVAAEVGRPEEWVRGVLDKLGKPYLAPVKCHPRRWHWERITPNEWKKLTAKQIAEIVTDDQGNHPTEAVVNRRRQFLRNSSRLR